MRRPVKPTNRQLSERFERQHAKSQIVRLALEQRRKDIEELRARIVLNQSTLAAWETEYLEAIAALPCHPVWLKRCRLCGHRFFSTPDGKCPDCFPTQREVSL